jgi:hypothetical protein
MRLVVYHTTSLNINGVRWEGLTQRGQRRTVVPAAVEVDPGVISDIVRDPNEVLISSTHARAAQRLFVVHVVFEGSCALLTSKVLTFSSQEDGMRR